MFLRLISLRKRKVTSNASRQSNRYRFSWLLQKKITHLSLKKKWNAGKASNGKTIIRTKSSLLVRQKSIKINYTFRYNKLGFISSFQFIPFKNKLLSLVYFSNGSISYFVATRPQKLFSFWYFNKYYRLKKVIRRTLFSPIFRLKKLIKLSLLEILPGRGAQYCRSSGTSGRLLRFIKENHTVMIQLPSGVKKLFSYYSVVCLGLVKLKNHRRYKNTRSGYWRSFGVKPIVRGVAMNPVDHPHGGRTKSIRYPRTPWGKTTKFK